MPFRVSPDGEIFYVSPGAPTPGDEDELTLADIDSLIDAEVDKRLEDISQRVATTTGRTTGVSTSLTEQISRRFFDVPTPEEFLNDFETAYGGFIENMREQGLGSSAISLALDPATGLMDRLMSEYMGGLAERANAGEDIFGLVGTEEDFDLIRTEPGTESITTGETKQVSTQKTRVEGEEKPTAVSQFETKTTQESKFKGETEVFARPKIASVFKFSPTDFLNERFHGDAGELATFVESEKGVRQRQRQTLAGGVAIAGRQT